ncbi:MAG: alpha/beta hydrolase [Lachnoclostridium sp.]|nr:alpha/beta hydrolase [Lachnoclostridium sp.]
MKRLIFAFIVMAVTAITSTAVDINGIWKGVLMDQIPVVIRITNPSSATLSSPSQGMIDMPVDKAVIDTVVGSIHLELNSLGITLDGQYNADNELVDAIFIQGATIPLRLQRGSEADLLIDRPQSPRPPYYYNVEDVTFTNGHVTLAGTLTTPLVNLGGNGIGALVLITGSGTQNRDEEIAGHKPFAVIADFLTRAGWAVLRYDDRGAGGSSPSRPGDTTLDFASDAMAAVRFLQSRPEVDPSRIGLLGHSEGGTIAFINAATHPEEIAFVVSLAGAALKGADVMVSQNRMMAEAAGRELSPSELESISKIFNVIATESDSTAMASRLDEAMREAKPGITDEEIQAQIRVMTSPWYVNFVRLDPALYLSKITCPVLALNGTYDLQVECGPNLEAIKAAVPSATVEPIPGANHFFQKVDSPIHGLNPGTHSETISPDVLSAIARWLTRSAR